MSFVVKKGKKVNSCVCKNCLQKGIRKLTMMNACERGQDDKETEVGWESSLSPVYTFL